jgi:hypothetical protein
MPFEALLDQDAIVRVASYANVNGVRTAVYADTARKVSLQPMNARDRDAHAVEIGEIAFKVYFATPDPGVKRGDRIVVASRSYEVLAPAYDEAGKGVVFKVSARLVT